MKNKKIDIIILIFVTIFVLYFSLKDNFFDIVAQLKSLNLLWIIIAITFTSFYLLLKTLAFNNIIKKIHKEKYSETLKLALETQFFNAITPFATGGQPFQIYHFIKKGISLSSSVNIVTQNFIVYQIALVILGTIAIISNYFLNLFPEISLLKQLVTIGFIVNTFIIVILFIISFSTKFNKFIINLCLSLLDNLKLLKNKEETQKKWDNYINNFKDNATILMKDKKNFFLNILYNFLALISLYIVPLFILYSLGDYHSFNALESITAISYVMLMGSYVPIPGGTGGLEFGFISFFKNFITGSKLNAIMLMWRFITYYLTMIVGAITLNIKKSKQIKKI